MTVKSVFDYHQLAVARGAMKMHCVGVRIMGGPDHGQAVEIIKKITGRTVRLDNDCTCVARQSRDDGTGGPRGQTR